MHTKMRYREVGRPTLSPTGDASKVFNFRLTKQHLDKLEKLHQLSEKEWEKKISFSELVRRILLQTPIRIRVSILEHEYLRTNESFREILKLVRKKKELNLEELEAAFEPISNRLEYLENAIRNLKLEAIEPVSKTSNV